jgi:hypothetical protein
MQNEIIERTDTGQCWGLLSRASHIEQRNKGFVRNTLKNKLERVRRISYTLKALED